MMSMEGFAGGRWSGDRPKGKETTLFSMTETVQGPDFHPLYRQVKELLLQRVLSGDWKPGELLPSESKLAEEFQVSQGTVRKALEEMAAEHLVVRHQGKGTFVTARGAEQPVHFFSMTTADHAPVGPRSTVSLSMDIAPATAEEQKNLQIEPGVVVARIFRVRAIGGVPSICDDIALEHERFPNFLDILNEQPHSNAYLVMEKEYGILVVRADEWVGAMAAEEREAEALNVEVGYPLLQIFRISYGLDGKPVEVRTIRIDSRDCLYFNRLS